MPSSRDLNVHVHIPSGSSWVAKFGMSLANMMAYYSQNRVGDDVNMQRLSIRNVQSSMLCQSRETLFRAALKSPATHILFLDSDMEFPAYSLNYLLGLKSPFVAANYTIKQYPNRPTARDSEGMLMLSNKSTVAVEHGMHVGLGLALLELDPVREAGLKSPFFPFEWSEEAQAYAGEDVAFCRKLGDAGIPLMISNELSMEITHWGMHGFKMDTASMEGAE